MACLSGRRRILRLHLAWCEQGSGAASFAMSGGLMDLIWMPRACCQRCAICSSANTSAGFDRSKPRSLPSILPLKIPMERTVECMERLRARAAKWKRAKQHAGHALGRNRSISRSASACWPNSGCRSSARHAPVAARSRSKPGLWCVPHAEEPEGDRSAIDRGPMRSSVLSVLTRRPGSGPMSGSCSPAPTKNARRRASFPHVLE